MVVVRSTNIVTEKMNNIQPTMRFFIITFLLISVSAAFAQKKEIKQDTVVPGTVHMVQDSKMDLLLEQDAKEHEEGTFAGFRIQIAAGTNRTNVYKVKTEFYRSFNDIPSYVVFESPNFKLRVGNYRTRLEAHKALLAIRSEFSGAFIVRDELELEELYKD